jgi:hypothetical protein
MKCQKKFRYRSFREIWWNKRRGTFLDSTTLNDSIEGNEQKRTLNDSIHEREAFFCSAANVVVVRLPSNGKYFI